MRIHNQLSEWHRHIRRRRRAHRRFARQPVSRGRLLSNRSSAVRVRMPAREGVALLRPQDHIRRLRRHIGQKQPLRARAQHSVHRLASTSFNSSPSRCIPAEPHENTLQQRR